MINVQFTRDLVKSLIKFIQREPVNILKSRIHIRKRTLVPQRSGRHSEMYSAQYISTIDRTIYYLVEEKNTRNISSGTIYAALCFGVKEKLKDKHSIINSLLFEKNLAASQDRTYYGKPEQQCLSFTSYNGEEIKYAKSAR
ncbi:hypothetical protein AVEN_54525-1 [Araneus ventricosus]|uniref:Uncharacterized protein n=1 Tax=Araneus ventricosus TaxID=182803 RepID=A0A4Y2EIX4_ARAVE|nr:hypothetical protein AVEN_54525-1 [Araneus ventricosus]